MMPKLKKLVKKVSPLKKKATVVLNQPPPSVHPWRVCPYGEHWVRTHPMHTRPSKTHPEGTITTRHEHCALNPSGKDQLYPQEIQEIANQNFSNLKNRPCPLPSKFKAQGSKYDDFIAGWVQYWNDVLKPDEPLDPNLVKALIASESSFNPKKLANPKDSDSGRGLMQITNGTRKLLGGDPGGLKDRLITVTKTELNDPNTNICAGVRWLFEKRRLASSHLMRPASWIETVWEYKGIRSAKTKEDAEKIKNIFNGFYEEFKKCGKS
jgi:hypothetical protein